MNSKYSEEVELCGKLCLSFLASLGHLTRAIRLVSLAQIPSGLRIARERYMKSLRQYENKKKITSKELGNMLNQIDKKTKKFFLHIDILGFENLPIKWI